jgi:serine/threonine-protein kinase
VTLDVLKVLDFGLAADFAGNPGDEQAIHGTPLYLAPERRGGDGLVTPSADLYSLGALAWFLLVGRPPLIADNLPDVLELHAQVMPERPSIALGSDIHPGLEALIMGCLAKHPLQRPAGADSLRRDLLALDMEPWTDDSALAWWSTVGPGSGGLNQVRPEAETRLIT